MFFLFKLTRDNNTEKVKKIVFINSIISLVLTFKRKMICKIVMLIFTIQDTLIQHKACHCKLCLYIKSVS